MTMMVVHLSPEVWTHINKLIATVALLQSMLCPLKGLSTTFALIASEITKYIHLIDFCSTVCCLAGKDKNEN